MAYPISPQIYEDVNRIDGYRHWKRYYRQAPPYDLILDYDFRRWKRIAGSHTGKVPSGWSPTSLSTAANATLESVLYGRLISKIKTETSELGTFMAEYRSNKQMLNDRCAKLLTAAQLVRQMKVKQAMRALVKDKRLHRPIKAKDPAGAWLELSFGWLPTVADILSIAKVLASPFPARRVRVAGSTRVQYYHLYGGWPGRLQDVWWTYNLSMSTEVWVTNPNLYMANELGLLNPAVVAWELTRLSFVIDRFVTISTYLQSFTDFAGLSMVHPSHTKKYTWHEWNWDNISQGNLQWDIDGLALVRRYGIIQPTVALRPLRGLNLREGANYMALLAQQLRSF